MPKDLTDTKSTLHLGLVLFPGCMPAGLFAVADMARAANLRTGRERFRITWVGSSLEQMLTGQGLSLQPQATIASASCDALLIPGLWASSTSELDAALHEQSELIAALRALPQSSTLWSYCAGVPLLAAAGRLDGKAATATWWLQSMLEDKFPKVIWRFDDSLVSDKNIVTAAGPNGYLQLMLQQLAERLADQELYDVRDILMLPRPRVLHEAFRAVDVMVLREPQLRQLLVLAQRTAASELTLQRAAEYMNVSIRTLCRQIPAATGLAAADWLTRIKLRQVGDALSRTNLSIKFISDMLGYSSEASLHRTFRRTTGYTLTGFRQAYSEVSTGNARAMDSNLNDKHCFLR
jgi:transcriptional regulator GlxA family with amidase domain